jgi:hypothetical protein
VSHPSKIRGTRWESAVRDWWIARGRRVVRPALHGTKDKGDLFGIDEWTLQCKDTAKLDFAGAVDDARIQAVNGGTRFFAAIVKRRRKGVAEAYVVMPLEVFDRAYLSQPPVERTAA